MHLSNRSLSLAVGVAGAAWGVFWIPMRALEGTGLHGVWASSALFVIGLPLLLLWRPRRLLRAGVGWLFTGLLTGSAFSLYATALLYTDVVHTLLLFYLTPVWSTLLGWLMLGERVTRSRVLALVMGIGGLMVVLDYTHGFPLPRNLGDWMALLSGIGWAWGSVRIFGERYASAMQPTFGYYVGAVVFSLALLLLLPAGVVGPAPPLASALAALPWLVLMTLGFLLPTVVVCFLGTMRLSPGRVGLLLMGEALVGVVSAALLAGEPFGVREAAGAVLIVGAAFVEVLGDAGQAQTSPV